MQAPHTPGDGSVVLGTGDPGRLYVLQDRRAAAAPSRRKCSTRSWSADGALCWRAETPAKTAVTLAVRSGNTPEPDDTWSDWSAEQTDAQKAVAVRAGRSVLPVPGDDDERRNGWPW